MKRVTMTLIIVVLMLIGLSFASDPDSGKDFSYNYPYLYHVEGNEHFLPRVDTLILKIGISYGFLTQWLSENGWRGVGFPDNAIFTLEDSILNKVSDEHFEEYFDEEYRTDPDVAGILTLKKYFEGTYTLRVEDKFGNNFGGKVCIRASTEIPKLYAIFNYNTNKEIVDTLKLYQGETVQICLKRNTSGGWKPYGETMWSYEFCEEFTGKFTEILKISCNNLSVGRISTRVNEEKFEISIITIPTVPVKNNQIQYSKNKNNNIKSYNLKGQIIKNIPKGIIFKNNKKIMNF